MLITCKYSCNLCGINNRSVILPERLPGQDIKEFVEQVVAVSIQEDHQHKSPYCKAKDIQDLYIPIGTGGAGYL